jgi:multiple sugar transport system ATP-binding protein
MAFVRYRDATCRYPGSDHAAVDRLNLDVHDGELLVLVGPSGSGKSTALRLLAGLEPLAGGQVAIDGTDVSRMEPAMRDIAMVFQNYALYPHMTVAQNMGFALRLAGVPAGDRDKRVREAASLLDLTGLLDRKPRALSGGQRQRVAMGRAIVRKPRVFLMDEPLSNLDARLRAQTRVELAALQQRLGTTTLYVTHDQVEAMTLGGRIAVMDGGRLQQCAPPREVYQRPSNAFVAGFIGSPQMNLLELPLENGGARLGDGVVPLPPAVLDATARAGLSTVTVGVRPEALEPAAVGPITVPVDLVEVTGAEAYAYGKVGPATVVVRADGRNPPRRGEMLHVRVRADEVHAFHPGTGARLGDEP